MNSMEVTYVWKRADRRSVSHHCGGLWLQVRKGTFGIWARSNRNFQVTLWLQASRCSRIYFARQCSDHWLVIFRYCTHAVLWINNCTCSPAHHFQSCHYTQFYFYLTWKKWLRGLNRVSRSMKCVGALFIIFKILIRPKWFRLLLKRH